MHATSTLLQPPVVLPFVDWATHDCCAISFMAQEKATEKKMRCLTAHVGRLEADCARTRVAKKTETPNALIAPLQPRVNYHKNSHRLNRQLQSAAYSTRRALVQGSWITVFVSSREKQAKPNRTEPKRFGDHPTQQPSLFLFRDIRGNSPLLSLLAEFIAGDLPAGSAERHKTEKANLNCRPRTLTSSQRF